MLTVSSTLMPLFRPTDLLQVLTGDISGFDGLRIGSNGFRNDGVNRAVVIRRASMNSHDWIGGISNIKFKGDKMTYKRC